MKSLITRRHVYKSICLKKKSKKNWFCTCDRQDDLRFWFNSQIWTDPLPAPSSCPTIIISHFKLHYQCPQAPIFTILSLSLSFSPTFLLKQHLLLLMNQGPACKQRRPCSMLSGRFRRTQRIFFLFFRDNPLASPTSRLLLQLYSISVLPSMDSCYACSSHLDKLLLFLVLLYASSFFKIFIIPRPFFSRKKILKLPNQVETCKIAGNLRCEEKVQNELHHWSISFKSWFIT